jgi:hypothetical protein
MNLRWPTALLTLLCTGSAAADGEANFAGLCSAQEAVYFACSTATTRWISLCGTAAGALQYRFGRSGAVELQYPARAIDGASRMMFARYSRHETERVEVRFENHGADYVLFDYQEGAQRTAGVRVTTAGGKERDIVCSGPVASRLGELKTALRCDADSALNGGQCP